MHEHLRGIYTAVYHVQDIAKAKEWYAELLGKEPYFNQPFYVGFNVNGFELGLLPADDPEHKTSGCVAYWGVPDIAAAAEELESRGHSLFEPITDVGEGVKIATLRDEDGNFIGLIENPRFPRQD